MSRMARIGVVVWSLVVAIGSPIYLLWAHPEAFRSVTQTLILASVAVGLITGIVGIWAWIKKSPNGELRLLPESRQGRAYALCGMAIAGTGAFVGAYSSASSAALVIVPFGFALVALSFSQEKSQPV